MAITQIEKDGKKILRYEFQPKLENGTPIGGIQVVEGETHEELMEKAATNYEHLYRKNRELIRKTELSVSAPAPAPQFKPRTLTAEERMKIARDINDPEKIDAALDLALEAKFGAKPEQVSQRVEAGSKDAAHTRAAAEAAAWRDQHPEFYVSTNNVKDLLNWISNRGKTVTVENLEEAYKELAPALEQAPSSPERTQETPSEAAAPSRIAGTDGTGQRQSQVPTAVTRRQSASRGTAKKDGITIEQFRRMEPKERKEFIKKNPNYSFAS
jgi:hypothetical protein